MIAKVVVFMTSLIEKRFCLHHIFKSNQWGKFAFLIWVWSHVDFTVMCTIHGSFRQRLRSGNIPFGEYSIKQKWSSTEIPFDLSSGGKNSDGKNSFAEDFRASSYAGLLRIRQSGRKSLWYCICILYLCNVLLVWWNAFVVKTYSALGLQWNNSS